MLNFENLDFYKTAERFIPIIQSRMGEIKDFVNNLPEEYNGLPVCSDVRKQFYVKTMEVRLERCLQPIYQKTVNKLMLNENALLAETDSEIGVEDTDDGYPDLE